MSALSDFISDFNANGRIFWSGPAHFKGGMFAPFNSGKLPVVRGDAAAGTETVTLTNYSSGYGSIPPYLYGDDADDYLATNFRITFTNASSHSFEFLVYVKTGDFRPFISARVDGNNQWYLRQEDDGTLDLVIEKNNINRRARSAAGALTGGWHHIVAVKNGSNMLLYIDGVDVTDSSDSYGLGDFTPDKDIDILYLDFIPRGNPLVAWFAVWEKALSPSEVSSHYSLGEKLGGVEMRNLDFTEGAATLHNPEDDTSTAPAPVRLGDHAQAVAITVPARAVAAADVNVPLAVNLAEVMPAGFWSSIDTDGDEMVVTKQDGAEVDCDLVSFSKAGNTGHLKIQWHVLSTTEDTTLYIQYGGTTNRSVTATDTYKSAHNQAADYDFWYAMDMASGHLVDRVGNHTSTAETDITYGEGGVVGDAIEMDGDDSNATIGILPYAGRTSLTMLHWMKQTAVDIADFIFNDDVDGDNRIIVHSSDTGNGQYTIDLDNGGNAIGSIDYVDNGYVAGTWGQFGYVYDNAAGTTNADKLKIFQNHDTPTVSFTGTIPSSLADVSAQTATIGRSSDSIGGLLDEFRSVLAALTADQVAQAHYNEYFYSVGGGMVASAEMDIPTGLDGLKLCPEMSISI